MAIKLNNFVSLLFVGFIITSCEREVLEDALTDKISVEENATASQLIYAETFEEAAPFQEAHNTAFGASHAFSLVKDPVHTGFKASRFILKATDPMVSDGKRAEVIPVKSQVEKEMWYSFAVYFPATGYKKDSYKESISQWHQLADVHLKEKAQSPATHLGVLNDRFYLDIGYTTEKVSVKIDPDKRKVFDLGQVKKDSWHEFVFHFIHSYKSDGLIELWHNGTKVLQHKGGNIHNSDDMPKWKLGIYKWKWNDGKTAETSYRMLYFDNIKVGNAQATLAQMKPGAAPLSDIPEQKAGNTFTFVNAETDRDIAEIVDNSIMSLAAQKTKRITIRANPRDSAVGSVKFILSGTKDRVFIDNHPPFALFGDDGNGNYYYGNHIPPGGYTIKAIPYPENNGKGKAGEMFKVKFTVKKY